MEAVTGSLPNVIAKLGELLIGEYNLQKRVKGEIRFLQSELESMQGALEKVSNTPIDQLDNQDKIWARDLRELSYDIEDSIDTFMVHCMGNEPKLHGIKKFINRSVSLFRKAMMHHWISTEIIDIKSRVQEVAKRHDRYKINTNVAKPVTIDPRLFAQYKNVTGLVGIEEAREEVAQILMEGNKMSKQQVKIVSIVGFGGLGKTTLANVVYEKLRAQFECSAFVSVSRTPDLEKMLKDMFYQLAKKSNEGNNVTGELREFLERKRYLVIVDDIWDISTWKMIRCALPDNDVEYTIITTTRIYDVAEQVGAAYKLKPLSLNNSRKLLYRRIFANENTYHDKGIEKCPDGELAEVSDKILKKCAGVPLAIITMASLLASKARNKMEWYEVYNSIGTGLENNLDVNNMRKILSFSYYELPCHLKTCLLYLSVFPEDFEIDKDRLIKMWIAEGFIQCEKQRKSLFELGESYFNEFINRSMIQPIYDKADSMMYTCRVHDMVLDLIRSLSREENFVAILSDVDHISQSNTIRRLSLQNGMENHIMAQTTISLQQARSVVIFPSVVALVPALGSCRILRVLDLEGCNLSKYINSLNKYISSLHQLRYVGLRGTHINQLPEEIGNLQFLQTLDARGNEISSLPSTVVQLRNLICLHIDSSTRVPNGIGNLTCLEQLSWLGVDASTINIIEDLRQLTEIRRLWIRFDKWNGKLLECLCKLEKIQELSIMVRPGHRSIGDLDAWVAPRHLRELCTQNGTWFSALPAWVSPCLLTDLSLLFIAVKELHRSDLDILGKLPSLRCLSLEVDNVKLEILGEFIVGAGLYPCLVHCEFSHFVWPVVFQQGAMPRLRDLKLEPFYVREARQIANSDGGLDLGLGNLPSLQSVQAYLLYESASEKEAKEAEAVLLHAAEMHPNNPRHCIYIFDNSTKMASFSASPRLKRSMELLGHGPESKKMKPAHLSQVSGL